MTFYYPLRNLIQLQLFGEKVSRWNILKGKRTDFSMKQTCQRDDDRDDINLNTFETLTFFPTICPLHCSRQTGKKKIKNQKLLEMVLTIVHLLVSI